MFEINHIAHTLISMLALVQTTVDSEAAYLVDKLAVSSGETRQVVITSGTYDLSELPGIVVPEGADLTVVGQGEVKLIGSRRKSLFRIESGGSITLRNLSFEDWWMPVVLEKSVDHRSIEVRNCRFSRIENAAGTIYQENRIASIESFIFENNHVASSNRHGVQLGLLSGGLAKRVEINDNLIENVSGSRSIMAIGFVQSGDGHPDSSITIRGNTVRDLHMEPDTKSVFMGIYCQGENAKVCQNTVTGLTSRLPNRSAGIYINADHSVISNNTLSGTGTDGITVKQSTGLIISGNTVTDCSEHGIRIPTGSELAITGNTVSECGQRGAWLGVSDSVVSNNVFSDCSSAGLDTGVVLFVNSSNVVCSNNVIKSLSRTPPVSLRYTIDGHGVSITGNLLSAPEASRAIAYRGNAGRTLSGLLIDVNHWDTERLFTQVVYIEMFNEIE